MKKYYSLREISQELNIPKSTLVKYKDFFSDFLPFVGDGKRKKLSEEGIEILREVRDLRENEKYDWLEIRDILAEKYGEQAPAPPQAEQQPQLPAPVPPPAPPLTPKQVERINHLIFALAGEMARTREKLANIESAINENTRRIKHLESTTAAAVMDVRSLRSQVDGSVHRADQKNRRRFDAVISYMQSEFLRLNKAVKASAAQKPKVKTSEQETLSKLNDKIEKVIEDAALQQARYNLIKRENQVLRKKLEGAATDSFMEKGQQQGWWEIFRRKK